MSELEDEFMKRINGGRQDVIMPMEAGDLASQGTIAKRKLLHYTLLLWEISILTHKEYHEIVRMLGSVDKESHELAEALIKIKVEELKQIVIKQKSQ